MSTPFSIKDAKAINPFVKVHKVASYEINHIKLLEYLAYISTGKISNKLNVTLVPTLEEKFFVPMNYSIKSKLDWLAGYADADGSISRNGTNEALQISSIHKKFLIDVKLMLQTCGISSKVSVNMEKRNTELPDGRGGYKNYSCNSVVIVNKYNIY